MKTMMVELLQKTKRLALGEYLRNVGTGSILSILVFGEPQQQPTQVWVRRGGGIVQSR